MLNQTQPAPTHLYLLLDRSGSMEAIADDVLGAYNRFLADQQRDGPDARLTFVQHAGATQAFASSPKGVARAFLSLSNSTRKFRHSVRSEEALPAEGFFGRDKPAEAPLSTDGSAPR